MKKYFSIELIIVIALFISNIIYFSKVNDNSKRRDAPIITLYGIDGVLTPQLQPSLVKYEIGNRILIDLPKEATIKLRGGDEISRVLDLYSYTTYRFLILQMDVTDLKVTMNGEPIPVQKIDGVYYIDFERKDGLCEYEIIASDGHSKVTYIIWTETPPTAEDDVNILQGKQVLKDKLSITEENDILLSAYDNIGTAGALKPEIMI